MSTGTTKGAAAATARRVKLKLVNLLFNTETLRAGSSGNSSFDSSAFSYDDLRKAYLERLQLIHPDKIHANSHHNLPSRFTNQQCNKNADPFLSKDVLKREFQELQDTWDRYEELTKSMTKVIQGDGATANFTKFGVGCSFSDNDEEKALRTEITDQACRGWFNSGLVSSGITTENDNKSKTDEQFNNVHKNKLSSFKSRDGVSSKNESLSSTSLIDDSMFVHEEMSDKNDGPVSSTMGNKRGDLPRYRPTLVRGL